MLWNGKGKGYGKGYILGFGFYIRVELWMIKVVVSRYAKGKGFQLES